MKNRLFFELRVLVLCFLSFTEVGKTVLAQKTDIVSIDTFENNKIHEARIFIYDEYKYATKINQVDLICRSHDSILLRLPIPLMKPFESMDSSRTYILYNRIEKFYSEGLYRVDFGSDTSGQIYRKVFYNKLHEDLIRVKYYHLKTGEMLIEVVANPEGDFVIIRFFDNNQICKSNFFDQMRYKNQNVTFYRKIDSYYYKRRLIFSNFLGPCNFYTMSYNPKLSSFEIGFEEDGYGTLFFYSKIPKAMERRNYTKKQDQLWTETKKKKTSDQLNNDIELR